MKKSSIFFGYFMLTASQLNVLKSYFGPEGNFSLTILEDKTINAATKIIYLQRALDEPLHLFLASIDKLYNSDLQGQEKQNHLELLRCFKLINDLKFNHEVHFGVYGLKFARDHFFNMLGELESKSFEKMLSRMIKKLKGRVGLENDPSLIRQNCRMRLRMEYDIPPNIEWRSELVLPRAQQVYPKSRCSGFCIDLFNAISKICWLLSPFMYLHQYQEFTDEELDQASIDMYDFGQDEGEIARRHNV